MSNFIYGGNDIPFTLFLLVLTFLVIFPNILYFVIHDAPLCLLPFLLFGLV